MPKTCTYADCPRPIFGGGYCQMHQWMRGIKRTHNGKPLNPISPQLRKKTAEYASLRGPFLKENPLCKANLANCSKIATEVHHKRGRGKYLNDTTTWLPACRNCHHRIELFPKEAKELNLSQSRLSNDKRGST